MSSFVRNFLKSKHLPFEDNEEPDHVICDGSAAQFQKLEFSLQVSVNSTDTFFTDVETSDDGCTLSHGHRPERNTPKQQSFIPSVPSPRSKQSRSRQMPKTGLGNFLAKSASPEASTACCRSVVPDGRSGGGNRFSSDKSVASMPEVPSSSSSSAPRGFNTSRSRTGGATRRRDPQRNVNKKTREMQQMRKNSGSSRDEMNQADEMSAKGKSRPTVSASKSLMVESKLQQQQPKQQHRRVKKTSHSLTKSRIDPIEASSPEEEEPCISSLTRKESNSELLELAAARYEQILEEFNDSASISLVADSSDDEDESPPSKGEVDTGIVVVESTATAAPPRIVRPRPGMKRPLRSTVRPLPLSSDTSSSQCITHLMSQYDSILSEFDNSMRHIPSEHSF